MPQLLHSISFGLQRLTMKARAFMVLLFLGCVAAGWEADRLHRQIVQLSTKLEQQKTAGTVLETTDQEEAALKDRLAALAKLANPPSSAGAQNAKSSGAKASDSEAKQRAKLAFARNWLEAGSAPIYAHLARTLGLSDSQIDRLRDLNAERYLAMVGAFQQARANGDAVPYSAAAVQALIEPAVAGVENQMRQVLGDDGFAQLQQQIQLAPSESAVQQMSQTLASSNQPLTDAQKDQLAQLLTDTQPKPGGPVALNLLNLNQTVSVTDSAMAQAATILSPDQLPMLAQYQAVNQAKQTLLQIFRNQVMALSKAAAAQPKSP
jgi:hypothetical protein